MRNVKQIIEESISPIALDILVFGPQTKKMSDDERTLALQNKRIEIRDRLREEGHNVFFAEELVEEGLSGKLGNMMTQEELLLMECDLVVALVESKGTLVELGVITSKESYSKKAHCFLDKDHCAGLAHQACENAKAKGAFYTNYKHPEDLDLCHLLGYIRDSVEETQLAKYIS
ncbi:MAG: hypothetical protein AB3N14_12625 [Flavobacteriaceae bacterium]